MKVRIVDTIARGPFHEIFNASLLVMCLSAFDEAEYVCHRSQEECLRRVLAHHRPGMDLSRVRFRPAAVVRREGPAGWVVKYLLGAWLNMWYLLTAPCGTQIVYTYNNPFALWPVDALNRLLRRRVLIVCHGELELLTQRAPWYKVSGWFGSIMRRRFRRKRIVPGIRFCVLGQSILRNLQPYLSDANRAKFFAVDHPYFFSEPPAAQPHEALRIGSVGQLTPEKGLYTLLGLSRQIPVPLEVVGRTYGISAHGDYPNVRFAAGVQNTPIPREKYDAEIAALDYVVFAYAPDSYRLTASGAVFDALNMRKPVIALRNDYFADVLHLPVGYMADSAAEMAEVIERLTASYPEAPDYEIFTGNIDRLRAYYEVEAVAARFRAALAEAYPEN